jgi:hypothetical protein
MAPFGALLYAEKSVQALRRQTPEVQRAAALKRVRLWGSTCTSRPRSIRRRRWIHCGAWKFHALPAYYAVIGLAMARARRHAPHGC